MSIKSAIISSTYWNYDMVHLQVLCGHCQCYKKIYPHYILVVWADTIWSKSAWSKILARERTTWQKVYKQILSLIKCIIVQEIKISSGPKLFFSFEWYITCIIRIYFIASLYKPVMFTMIQTFELDYGAHVKNAWVNWVLVEV